MATTQEKIFLTSNRNKTSIVVRCATLLAVVFVQSALANSETCKEIAEIVSTRYITPIPENIVLASCPDSLGSILNHQSVYYDEDAFKTLRATSDPASQADIGIRLSVVGGLPTVRKVVKNSPADKSGVQAGDVLISIDDTPTTGLALAAITSRIRGSVGSQVSISTLRSGTSKTLLLSRELIKTPVVTTQWLDSGYLLIGIEAFRNDLAESFTKAVGDALAQQPNVKLSGIVLDLRNNAGGLLSQAVALAAAFLPQNAELITIKGRTAESTRTFHSNNLSYDMSIDLARYRDLAISLRRLPIAVVVNRQTAAASEFVAELLRDRRQAPLIGTPTSGKTTIESIISLKGNQGALKLSVAQWVLPGGRMIGENGVLPDFVSDTADTEEEPINSPTTKLALYQLKRHVENVVAKNEAEITRLRGIAQKATADFRRQDAIQYWTELLKWVPDDAQAFRHRAVLYAEIGEMAAAEKDLAQLSSIDMDSYASWNSVCWIRVLQNSKSFAVNSCEHSVAMSPQVESLFNLGHAYLLRGAENKAWEAYRRSISMIEDDEILKSMMEDFRLIGAQKEPPTQWVATRDRYKQEADTWLRQSDSARASLRQWQQQAVAPDTNLEQNIRLGSKVLAEYEALLPADNPQIVRIGRQLADYYLATRDYQSALPLYFRAITLYQNQPGKKPQDLLLSFGKLWACLLKTAATQENVSIAKKAFEILDQRWPEKAETSKKLMAELEKHWKEFRE